MSLTVFSSYEESHFFHLIQSTRVNPRLWWRADFVYFPSLQVTGEFTLPDLTEVWVSVCHLIADVLWDHSIGCRWDSRMDRQHRAQGVSLCSTVFSDSGSKAACKLQSTSTGKMWEKKQWELNQTFLFRDACSLCHLRFISPRHSANSVLSYRLLSTSQVLICKSDWLTKSTIHCLKFISTIYSWRKRKKTNNINRLVW